MNIIIPKNIFLMAIAEVNQISWTRKLISTLGLILLTVQLNQAQCEQTNYLRIAQTSINAPNQISVRFSSPLSQNDAAIANDPTAWRIIEDSGNSAGQASSIMVTSVSPTAPTPPSAARTLVLNQNLNPETTYYISIRRLAASAKCVKPPLIISFRDLPTQIPVTEPNPSSLPFKLNPAKEKKDSELYVEGLIEGARHSKTIFSVDAYFNKQYHLGNDSENYLNPFFTIKGSSAKKADNDTITFGLNHIINKSFTKSVLNGVEFVNGGKVEANREFRNVNLLAQTRLNFPLKSQKILNSEIVPFIGFEAGRNLRSPVLEARGKPIARPFFGAELRVPIYLPEAKEPLFDVDIQYIRRFPLIREVSFEVDDNNNLIALPINRRPRDYVKTSINFAPTQMIGFTLKYEYGGEPPQFKLLDSKFSFGLVFKAKIKKN